MKTTSNSGDVRQQSTAETATATATNTTFTSGSSGMDFTKVGTVYVLWAPVYSECGYDGLEYLRRNCGRHQFAIRS